jgi:hypothetical protein
MCELNPSNAGRRIDPCMRRAIMTLNARGFGEIVACCCGHGRYPMAIVFKGKNGGLFELFSDKQINRKKRIYSRDVYGYYYIPETLETLNNRSHYKSRTKH